MIDFSCRCYHKDRTPIVKDLYIQDYAEALLADYRPELLKTPGKVDAFHFLENYLGVTVEFQDIFYPEGKIPVAGATIFNDEAIMVFDRSGMKVSSIDVPAGTVLIDNATMKSESFALFTALHEGGHYCMHQGVYKLDPDQVSLFESDGHVVKCMRTTIERRGPLVTQKDFREHQASTFAAAMAMPRPTFIPLMRQVIREAGFSEGIWVEDPHGDWEDQFKLDDMIKVVTDTYGVSYTAAAIQLRRQGLLMKEWQYDQMKMRGV